MSAFWSLLAVIILMCVAYFGVATAGMTKLFGVVIPYAAVIIFFVGFIWRIVDWARSAVPFAIATTGGQQKSLDWIKPNRVDNPASPGAVVMRMIFEVLTFRSLFRNTSIDYRLRPDGTPAIRYTSNKFLWIFALMFHYSFLVVILWHLRFFSDPTPLLVNLIEDLDGFAQVGLPRLLISGVVLFAAAGYLLTRRLWKPSLRYISLASDYFPLLLIMAIAATGILMRYLLRVDVMSIKEFTMSLVTLSPAIPEGGLSPLFYMHLFLVSVLFIYFPFSKLMHLGGVFMSPTRNMMANSREWRHVNPWNYPVKTHTYAEYEEEFHELMEEKGVPLDKEYPKPEPEPEPEEAGADKE